MDVLRIQVAAKEAQREAAQRVIEQEGELMLHERELRQAVSKTPTKEFLLTYSIGGGLQEK